MLEYIRSQSAGDPLQDRSLGFNDAGMACTPINDIKMEKHTIRIDNMAINER
jgi:hypothetical protein